MCSVSVVLFTGNHCKYFCWRQNLTEKCLSYKPVLSNHISFLIARKLGRRLRCCCCKQAEVLHNVFNLSSTLSPMRMFFICYKTKNQSLQLKICLPEISTHLVWACVSVCVCLWCWSAEFKHDNPHQLSQIRALQAAATDYITVRDTIRDGDRHRKRGKSRVRENNKAEKGRMRHGCQIVSDMAHLKIHDGNKTSNKTRK